MKREVLQDRTTWPDQITCRRQSFAWLVRYNAHRRHSYLKNLPPNAYETLHSTTLPTAA